MKPIQRALTASPRRLYDVSDTKNDATNDNHEDADNVQKEGRFEKAPRLLKEWPDTIQMQVTAGAPHSSLRKTLSVYNEKQTTPRGLFAQGCSFPPHKRSPPYL